MAVEKSPQVTTMSLQGLRYRSKDLVNLMGMINLSFEQGAVDRL